MTSPTWGDTVRITDTGRPGLAPGALAAVCGMRRVETIEQADRFGCPIGAIVYLVKLADGSSPEVSATDLELVSGE